MLRLAVTDLPSSVRQALTAGERVTVTSGRRAVAEILPSTNEVAPPQRRRRRAIGRFTPVKSRGTSASRMVTEDRR